MRIIAIVNQKGGCGKTTTAINLAALAARRGRRTLLVDMDPQSHCAAGLGIPEDAIEGGTTAVMRGECEGVDPEEVCWEVGHRFQVLPSTIMLSAVEASAHDASIDMQCRLEQFLGRARDSFDCCYIDCPPALGILTFSSLRAATEALIPVETGYFSLRGAQRQVGHHRSVGATTGPHLATMDRADDSRPCVSSGSANFGNPDPAIRPVVGAGGHSVARLAP